MVRKLITIALITLTSTYAIADRTVKGSIPILSTNTTVTILISNPSNISQDVKVKMDSIAPAYISVYTASTIPTALGIQWTCTNPIWNYLPAGGSGGFFPSCTSRDEIKTVPPGSHILLYASVVVCNKSS